MVFDPAAHLRQQGWQGHGAGLKDGGRARPLVAVSKKTAGGVGHGLYDASPWWEDVYSAAAKPKKGKERADVDQAGVSTSVAENVAAARQQGARRNLYAAFLRGEVVPGSEDEQLDRPTADNGGTTLPKATARPDRAAEDAAARAEKRRKRRAAAQCSKKP